MKGENKVWKGRTYVLQISKSSTIKDKNWKTKWISMKLNPNLVSFKCRL